MFTIMYDIGCRVGELLDIKLRDLFLDTDAPHVRIRGKGDKSRNHGRSQIPQSC
jgi:Site-specific recombinase XerD